MNNNSVLKDLHQFVQIIQNSGLFNKENISEDFSRIEFSINSDKSLTDLIPKLTLMTSFLSVIVEIQIQQGIATISINDDGKFHVQTPWVEDLDLSPPVLDEPYEEDFQSLIKHFSHEGDLVDLDVVVHLINELISKEADVEIITHLSIDKLSLLNQVVFPNDLRIIFFFYTEKLIKAVKQFDLNKYNDIFAPYSQCYTILLLADGSGEAKGSNIAILGLDHWKYLWLNEINRNGALAIRVHQAIALREVECNWKLEPSNITPYHFALDYLNFEPNSLCLFINGVCEYCCVAYLANRISPNKFGYEAEFYGYQSVIIQLPHTLVEERKLLLFPLYQWAFENSTSDKLEITRNIISLQLNQDPESNLRLLQNNSQRILEASKGNFRYLIKKSVELYFEKRLKLNSYLQEYSEITNSNITNLTTDLVGNLYKTIGIMLGVVITALIDPHYIRGVIFWTSILYSIYLFFVIGFFLPHVYIKYRSELAVYNQNRKLINEVLVDDEIKMIEGNLIRRNRWRFLFYFGTTNLGYAILALVAVLIFKAVQ